MACRTADASTAPSAAAARTSAVCACSFNDDHDDAAEKSDDTYGGKRIPDRASRTLVMLG